MLLPGLAAARHLARVLKYDAMEKHDRGNESEALDRVLGLLQTEEVRGYNIDLGSCTTVSCRLDSCQPVTLKPCAKDFRCRIVESRA